MKTITVRELRSEFPKAMKWIDHGERVQITRRGKIVAELAPPSEASQPPVRVPNFAGRLARRDKGASPMAQTWASLVSEERD